MNSVTWYYVGIKRLLAGDQLGAREYLQKAAAIELKYPPEEYQWAKSELKLLSK
jgi:hypothetical protein